MGQAIPPILAVINRFELAHGCLLLLLKWEGRLGLWCPKTVCPSLKPSGSFWKLHFWNQQIKLHYLHYQLRQYIDFCLDSISSLVWKKIAFLFYSTIFWTFTQKLYTSSGWHSFLLFSFCFRFSVSCLNSFYIIMKPFVFKWKLSFFLYLEWKLLFLLCLE